MASAHVAGKVGGALNSTTQTPKKAVIDQINEMNNTSPFACNMNALSREERLRHSELGRVLRSSLLAVRELANGYEFEFPPLPANYRALTELTPMEHACCPFFEIGIIVRHDDKLVWQLTGDEGVKEFIRMEFGSWFQAGSR